MNRIRDSNREKAQRIREVIFSLFSSGYIKENGVLSGGAALNLAFTHPRFITDIDLHDGNRGQLSWKQSSGYFFDEVRSYAGRAGYVFTVGVRSNPKMNLYYESAEGTRNKISIDLVCSSDAHILTPQERDYSGIGRIASVQMEELIGRKVSMLFKPKSFMRGEKKYTDLLDVYHASFLNGLDEDMTRKVFVRERTRLGASIHPNSLPEALESTSSADFESHISLKTDRAYAFFEVRSTILARYASLCRLTPSEAAYNKGMVPRGDAFLFGKR